MECFYKGKPVIGSKGMPRKPLCKRWHGKCVGEKECRYIKDQERIIENQKKRQKK